MSFIQTSSAGTLGRLVKEYERARWLNVKVIVLTLVCGLIAVLCFGGAFWAVFFSDVVSSEGPFAPVAAAVVGSLFTLFSLTGGYSLWRGTGSSASLYENGLIYRFTGKEFVTTWDEIASFTEYNLFRVEKKNGEEFSFGRNIEGFAEVVEKIKEETLRLMLPEANAAILSGATLEFKSTTKIAAAWVIGQEAMLGFRLDGQGITYVKEGKRIAWSEDIDVGIVDEYYAKSYEPFFTIVGQNEAFRVRWGIMPNAHLLLALCEEMVSQYQTKSHGIKL